MTLILVLKKGNCISRGVFSWNRFFFIKIQKIHSLKDSPIGPLVIGSIFENTYWFFCLGQIKTEMKE